MKISKRAPSPPEHLSDTAKAEWKRLHSLYKVDADAIPVLVELLEAQDRKREARAAIEKDGLFIKDRFGVPKVHPAAAVERDARLQILRALRALGLPGTEEKQRGRPPH